MVDGMSIAPMLALATRSLKKTGDLGCGRNRSLGVVAIQKSNGTNGTPEV